MIQNIELKVLNFLPNFLKTSVKSVLKASGNQSVNVVYGKYLKSVPDKWSSRCTGITSAEVLLVILCSKVSLIELLVSSVNF